MDIRRYLEGIEPGVSTSPWPGHELVRGYAVMVLPFSTGHLLALRAWRQNDFAPYVSVWHRGPDGGWGMYSDGTVLEATCPRYWGDAVTHAGLASIDLEWTGPDALLVRMEEPRLEWTMTLSAPLPLRVLNALSAAMPLWTWKPRVLRRIREWAARGLLGMGEMHLSFTSPSGFDTIIMPERVYFVATSSAVLEGRDLGRPVRLDANPTLGSVPLPTRAVFAIGQAHARSPDPEEYRRTRRSARAAASRRAAPFDAP